MSLDPDIAAKVRTSFDRQTMMQTIGASIAELEAGRCVIVAPIGPGLRQQQGAGHGGLAFTIGDSAAGYAALSLMPSEVEVMTVEVKINYMSPATGTRLIAEGRVIRPGRRIMVVAADIWAESDDPQAAGKRRHVAVLQGTMIPVAV